MHSWLAYLTNICQLQILVMLWEWYTCTNIGNLPVSHQVSVNMTLIKHMTMFDTLFNSDLLLHSHDLFILDKHVSQSCGQSASFGTSHLQVHTSWECNHGDQTILKYACLQDKSDVKVVQSLIWLLVQCTATGTFVKYTGHGNAN